MTHGRRLIAGLVVLAACLVAVVSPAEDDFSKGLLDRGAVLEAAKKATRETYPDADEVVVDRIERVRYKSDGTYVQWAEEYVRILTEKSRRAHSTLSSYFTIPYQRGPEDCGVPLVEIIKPDGKVVVLDVAANSKLMIDPSGMDANIYNPNDKVIRINVPSLDVGDILHVVMFDRVVQPRIKDTFCDWQNFEGTRPLMHAAVEIRAPKDLPLRRIAVKDPVDGTLTAHKPVETDDEIVYRWEARDVPQMFPEPDMPPVHMVTQRVLVSTAPDWQTLSRWYWKLSEPHFAHTPEMQAEVDRLVKGLTGREEKIEAVFKYVSQQVRYMGITAEADAPGYEPHDVKDTFTQKHGVCRDKAALLVVMLRLAGFDAFPVLIHNGPRKDEEVPQPYFNHAISAVRNADGGYLLMDPTDESTRQLLPSYLNDKSYLVATPEGDVLRTSPIIPADENLMHIETTGSVDARGNLKVRTTLTFDGINDNAYRGYFARSKPEVRRRYFEGAVQQAAAGARLTDIRITPDDMQDTAQPLVVRLDFEAPDVLIRGGGYVMLPVPALGQRVGIVNFIIGRTGLRERRYPLVTGYACGVHETVTVTLDETLRDVVLMPTCEPVDDPTLSWRLDVRRDGDTLRGEGDFRLKVVEFTPAQYLSLKKTLKRIELDLKKMPIFRGRPVETATGTPGADAPGDILVLDADIDYNLTDARSWTETRTVRFKVLTYAGKKQFSEIKVPYLPEWETVRMEKAVVTSADGEKREISDKEINVMDAPAAGTAPRYPVPKVFVASLPGVDVGSTVEYRLVRVAAARPFFSCRESFQNFHGIEKKTVTVLAPAPGTILKRHVLNGTSWLEESGTGTGPTGGYRAGFIWTARNAPALKREDLLPPRWSFTPTVFVTTGSWQQYAARVYPVLLTNSLGQPRAETKARELVVGKRDAADRLRVIRDFVVLNVREAGPGLADMPLRYVTNADRTLAEGYGNTTDRAVLLCAMLRAVGFSPEFVLASPASRVETLQKTLLDNPDCELFDTVLVRVKTPDGTVYLNDTDQYAVLGSTVYEGRPGLVLPAGKTEIIEAAPGRSDLVETTFAIKLDAAGDAVITRTRHIYGTEFAVEHKKFAEMPPEDRRRYHLELMATIAQNAEAVGDLNTDFTSYPGVETFTVRVKDFAVRDADYLYFDLPESLEGLFWLRSDKRDNPLYLSDAKDLHLNVHVLYPATLEPVMMPQAVSWQTAEGTVRVSAERSAPDNPDATGRALSVTAAARLAPAVVSPAQYAALFELNRKLSHRAARMILLRTVPPAARETDR